ncbi:hypothetical protein LWI29_002613 [Acer saccharum]|uniref:Uncharacterized protein n=1 Tax=Acer saccharum TaxID=4024 RepID=A0AA39RPL1_ACESA|nr:hypothetical protein LWI29_002613 [Acer saccharum]
MITTITEIVIMTGTVILTVTKIGGIDIVHVQRINQGTDPDQSLHPIPPRKASGEVVLIWRHLLHPCCLVLLFQLGALPMMPVEAMTQQATRHARRVYVGGPPPLANEQVLFSDLLLVLAFYERKTRLVFPIFAKLTIS